MANTPQRTIRVSDELWQAAKEAAEERNENLTEVLVEALARYAEEHRKEAARG